MNFQEWLIQQESLSAGYRKSGQLGSGKGFIKPEQRPHGFWGSTGWAPKPGGEVSPNATPAEKAKSMWQNLGANAFGQFQNAFMATTDFGKRSAIAVAPNLNFKPIHSFKAGMRKVTCPHCQQSFMPPEDLQSGDPVDCVFCKQTFELPEGIKQLTPKKKDQDQEQEQNFGQPERWQIFDLPIFQGKSEEQVNRLLQIRSVKQDVIKQCKSDLVAARMDAYANVLDWNPEVGEDNDGNIQYYGRFPNDKGETVDAIIVHRIN